MGVFQENRKIIHADMDAFYASVEIRENSSLKGKPVVVGGSPNSRSVVCAASYEARKFGIRSAIPCSQAKRLCPDVIFIQPNFQLYKQVSSEIHEIFKEYTDLVEPISLDEAYLDVTVNKKDIKYATVIAEEIKHKVKSLTSLTISCGVSYNKFLAKIASDWNKPDGICVIRPSDSEKFLNDLPIGKFYGIGKVTEKKMKDMGINFGRDLKSITQAELEKIFGKAGLFFYEIVRGIDNRSVNKFRERKSIGIEDTFQKDTEDKEKLKEYLDHLVTRLYKRVESKGVTGKCLSLKIKYSDFREKSISKSCPGNLIEDFMIRNLAHELFSRLWDGRGRLRLLGLSISSLVPENEKGQLILFS